MKNLYFSALIFCGIFAAAQTNGQILTRPGDGVSESQGSGFDFKAIKDHRNNVVMIQWRAFNEGNTDHYVLEHSGDGIAFTALSQLAAIGDTDGNYSYNDMDSYPPAPENFYRLKVVQKDGSSFYSDVVPMDMSDKKIPHLNPTVLHMGATLHVDQFYRQPLMVDFFDQAGRRMGSYLVNSEDFDINTAGWGKGIYFYRICNPTHALIDAGKILVL